MPEGITDSDWQKRLTPEQYRILRRRGTEPAFTGKLLYNKDKGVYVCAGCGSGLFSSDKKYDSGTGWPSFTDAIKGSVELRDESSFMMHRTEVVCRRCGGHLGHVFDDGPKPAGRRFCINSAALGFKAMGKTK